MKISAITLPGTPPAPGLDLHAGQPVLVAGLPLKDAAGAMILVHGRGASAFDILDLALELNSTDFALFAPQAVGNTWYPQRFLAPTASNQPWLDSALAVVGRVVAHINAAGIPSERILLLGFSQGACLALEYTARNARRYGGIIGLSGGLIGTDDELQGKAGSLSGTPVFLGCSDIDPHIPLGRVHHTAQVLEALGGQVDKRIYPGMGHRVNEDEMVTIQKLMDVLGIISA